MKKLEEMTKKEFIEKFYESEDGDLLTPGIKKLWSSDNGGYWYLACTGESVESDVLMHWFDLYDCSMYCSEINAYI